MADDEIKISFIILDKVNRYCISRNSCWNCHFYDNAHGFCMLNKPSMWELKERQNKEG